MKLELLAGLLTMAKRGLYDAAAAQRVLLHQPSGSSTAERTMQQSISQSAAHL